MKYKIKNEFGETVAEVNEAVDTAHVYKVFTPDCYITGKYNVRLYPVGDNDSPYDVPSTIAARLIERGLEGWRKRRQRAHPGPKGRPTTGTLVHKTEPSLHWKNRRFVQSEEQRKAAWNQRSPS